MVNKDEYASNGIDVTPLLRSRCHNVNWDVASACIGGIKKEYDRQQNPVVHDWIRQLMALTALPAFAVPLV